MSGRRVDAKVVLLGQEGVGKSSLVERCAHGRFRAGPYQNVSDTPAPRGPGMGPPPPPPVSPESPRAEPLSCHPRVLPVVTAPGPRGAATHVLSPSCCPPCPGWDPPHPSRARGSFPSFLALLPHAPG